MGIIHKVIQKANHIYRHDIAREQYPMLTAISRRKQQRQGAFGVVYMLHHIAEKDDSRIPTNEDLKVSPQFLEKIITRYRHQGFDFLSLDQLSQLIADGVKPNRPFVCFTLDDGYLDNFTEALPIFERQQVPFTIFVTTDFIDQKAILWWDTLEELILSHDSLTVGNTTYGCHTFQERWDTFRILRKQILRLDQTRLAELLPAMFSQYAVDWLEPIRRQAMSWQQVKSASQHPLCTIGGHTVSHPALNKLSDDEFRREVTDGINRLETVTSTPIRHFAYPYGSPSEIGEREYRLVSEFRFKTVFSSYGGCLSETNKNNITHLPRVYLHER